MLSRPIIASPFMPTLATQISVDASTSQDPRRKNFPIITTNNNTTKLSKLFKIEL